MQVDNLTDLLDIRSREYPNFPIYTYLQDGEQACEPVSFSVLHEHSRAVAAFLQDNSQLQDRVMLLFPAGVEFVEAFMGCLLSKRIAVPLPPPRLSRIEQTLEKMQAIAASAAPKVVLTTEEIANKAAEFFDQIPSLRDYLWVPVCKAKSNPAEKYQKQVVHAEDIAYLQYTSGSTSLPKGVILTHENLMNNMLYFDLSGIHFKDSKLLTWLPAFHDLGLIYGLLMPLLTVTETFLMPNAAFIQRPSRWLEAISRYKITHTMGPNFSFDFSMRSVTEEQKKSLDLSSWQYALNGAEPVRMEVMTRFAEYFKDNGFDIRVFSPSWGLAEASCIVTGSHYLGEEKPSSLSLSERRLPTEVFIDSISLLNNKIVLLNPNDKNAISMAGSGFAIADSVVKIVNPKTCEECSADQVGEVWVANKAVSPGYWERPEQSKETFGAKINGANDGLSYMRTGDLGFLYQEELFITGRMKDVIIIRGQNHYPQDIEWVVEQSHASLRSGGSAAFSITVDNEERLSVVVEVDRRFKKERAEEAFSAIRQAVSERFDLQVEAISFIRMGSIPKTTSGKIQRRGTKEQFLNNQLKLLAQWQRVREKPTNETTKTSPTNVLFKWLKQKIAHYSGIAIENIGVDASFGSFGLDSEQSVRLIGELEQEFGFNQLPSTLAYDYPSITKLSEKLNTLQVKVETAKTSSSKSNKAVAVIGMACRFPGADTVAQFESLLWQQEQAIQNPSPTREKLVSQLVGAGESLGAAGYIENVDQFDAAFFNISHREAEQIDPQQRLILQTVWHALEDAGLTLEALSESNTGVFVGISHSDYNVIGKNSSTLRDGYSGTGTATSIAANRISYFLNIHGPSVAIDTACSSSLTALHTAVKSIQCGECDSAIVVGSNLILDPDLSRSLREAGMLSASNRCHSFGHQADGYVRGEGVGAVILQNDALTRAQNYSARAFIAGSAMNQDGKSFGLTAPNGVSQQKVLQAALADAGISAAEIDYVEAHGTGTTLGDPIELSALQEIYGNSPQRKKPCIVGSVKANIGHLEAAAGIAGVIKSILILQKGDIPLQPNLNNLNPKLIFNSDCIDIGREISHKQKALPLRYVGVTSMGFGGTNVHVILQKSELESNAPNREAKVHDVSVLPLSAKSIESLSSLCLHYRDLLAQENVGLAQVTSLAALKRTHFPYRVAVSGSDKEKVIEKLDLLASEIKQTELSSTNENEELNIAFVFSGQGSQFSNMAKNLYASSREFKTSLDKANEYLIQEHAYPLCDNLFGQQALDDQVLSDTHHTQICLFAVEYALAQTLINWGVKPKVLVGHSLGEYVAATLAGAMTLEQALTLVFHRSRLMSTCQTEGAMLAVVATEEKVEGLFSALNSELSIAAINSQDQITVSGKTEEIERFYSKAKEERIPVFKLAVTQAFHSPLMNDVAEEFRTFAEQVHYKPLSESIVIGNVQGEKIAQYNANYWVEHLLNTVYFEKCIKSASSLGINTYIEICARPVLSAQINQTISSESQCLHTSLFGKDEGQALSDLLAYLYEKNVALNWQRIVQDTNINRVSLPLYPFTEQSYWLKPAVQNSQPAQEIVAEKVSSLVKVEKTAMSITHSNSNTIKDKLVSLLATLLHTNEANINTRNSFLELGADSLVLVEYVKQINDTYSVELAMPMLFETLATIPQLANWLEEQGCEVCEVDVVEQINDRDVSENNASIEQPQAIEKSQLSTNAGSGELNQLVALQLDAFNQMVEKQLSLVGSAKSNSVLNRSEMKLSSIIPSKPNKTVKRQTNSGFSSPLSAAGGNSTLDDKQKAHLNQLIQAYQQKTVTSKQYAEQYRKVFSDYRSSLGFRSVTKELIYPLVVESAKGSKIVDLDGHEYIDLTMAFGSSLMGYNPDFIAQAMVKQINGNGIQVGPKSPLSGKAAALVSELTGCERVAFANSGTEAVMTAVRLARAVTGRTKIVRFAGAYHGHADVTLVKKSLDPNQASPIAPGVPESVASDALVLDFVDSRSIDIIRENLSDIAAILVEPIQSRRPGLQSAEFLKSLRQLADESGCALIFDEIITGFRLAQGGAQEYFDVKADLVVYGKVAGGGMPIGVISGCHKFMDAIDGGVWSYGDNSTPAPGATFFAGTFSGHPVTMSSTIAILELLKEQRGEIQNRINGKTKWLVDNINQYFKENAFPIHVDRAGSLFRFVFFNNFSVEFQPIEANLFFYNMTLRGVYIWEGHTCFISDAHSQEDLDTILSTVKASAQAMREGGFFSQKLDQDEQALAHLNTQATAYVVQFFIDVLGDLQSGEQFTQADLQQRAGADPKYYPLIGRLIEILETAGIVKTGANAISVVQSFSTVAKQVSVYEHTPISVLKLLERCAVSLKDVVTGKLNPADVLFSNDGFQLLESLYTDAPGSVESIDQLCKKVKFKAAQSSEKIRILEVGGGTGSATKELVAQLAGTDYSYTFTDISPGFFPSVRRLFGEGGAFEYRTFDIEKSAEAQGIQPGSFDVVLASNVVHATQDLASTIGNLKTLLRQNGMLLFLECVEKQAWLDVIFGLTEGWWRGVNCPLRDGYPLMPAEKWKAAFKALDFNAVDVVENRCGQGVISASGVSQKLDKPNLPSATHSGEYVPSMKISAAQQEILVHMDMAEELNVAYNEGALFELQGELDQNALQNAWNNTLVRHQSLQVKVNRDENRFEPHGCEVKIEFFDFSFVAEGLAQTKASQWIKKQIEKPFSLEKGPLIKAVLLKVAPQKHLFYVVGHHLIIDGIAYGVLITELCATYGALVKGETVQLPEALPLGAYAEQKDLSTAEAYWRTQFANGVPYLSLPTDQPFQEQQTFSSSRVSAQLTEEQSSALTRFGQVQNATPFMVFLSTYRLLLQKLCNQNSSVIGIPASVHPSIPGKAFLGYGVNLLPLMQSLDANDRFIDVVTKEKSNFFTALSHKEYPFSNIVQAVNPERNPSRPALITVLFNYEKIGSLQADNVTCIPKAPPVSYSKYELTLDVVYDGKQFELVLTYNNQLFTDQTAQTLLNRICRFASEVVENAQRPVADISILFDDEADSLIQRGEALQEQPQCLHHLFEQQVAKTSNAVALRCDDKELTYSELNERANQIAHYLMAQGVNKRDRVGVCLGRTPELIASLLGVMKCGAAYVPLDPKYPQERLDQIVENAQAKVILVEDESAYQNWKSDTQLVGMQQRGADIDKQAKNNPEVACAVSELGYLIYTSGSTGKPKGVAIEHQSAHAMIAWSKREFSPEQLAGVVASTSICFDLSIYEIFLPLAIGSKIILLENILYLPELEKQDDITLINTVPSAIEELVKQDALPKNLRVINLAGEALSIATVNRIRERAPDMLVYNLYGPSEDTTYTTWLKIPPERQEDVTIGFPIDGTEIYLLDDHLNLVPKGSVGTIYVAGEGLSRCYWNNKESTAAAFIPNPFSKTPGARMYCTGDLGKLNESGEIVYLGRQDYQVKVRGHRIELGEIESAMEAINGVQKAVVLATGPSGKQRITGFYVCSGKENVVVDEVRNYLAQHIPSYMVPSHIHILDAMPLTPNGKTNRKALEAMIGADKKERTPVTAVVDSLAISVKEIWQGYLQRDDFDVTDDFFALGGHSLMATQIIFDVNKAFSTSLKLTDLMRSPSVHAFSQKLKQAIQLNAIHREAEGV